MPQLGPAFLHSPLKLPAFASFGERVRWLADGALSSLPRQIIGHGWRAQSLLCSYAGDGSTAPLGLIETSWSGAGRLAKCAGEAGGLPVSVALDPNLVFVTHADLPLAARGTLNKTIALRMDDLSPIPPTEATFAVGEIRRNSERLEVDVAIVRRKTVSAAAQAFASRPVLSIGAAPMPSGAMKYLFTAAFADKAQRMRKWLFAMLAIWGSALLALGGIEARQEKMLAVLDAYQGDLRVELHQLKTDSENLERLQKFTPQSHSFAEIANAITNTLNALPEGAVVTELSFAGDGVTISGLSPANKTDDPINLNRTASDYPGFDWFSLSAPAVLAALDEAQDE